MRTLLIDNYDSFTYNLAHDVARATGSWPTVVRNDDQDWRPSELDRFDHVIVSPGPGTPEREADFGICAEVIATADLPLLGVCLGHQGIAHVFGATVVPAPVPRHGEESVVRHSGDELFAHVPESFRAIRYHSLAVTGLPEELLPIAWTDDGVLMGLRHRDRPFWGVQFHPESIGTPDGSRIMRNFLAVPPRRSPVSVKGLDRVVVRTLSAPVTAEQVFERCFADSEHAVWLDSGTGSPGGTGPDRFSFLVDASGPAAQVATANVSLGTVTISSATDTQTIYSGFFDWLDRDLAARRTIVPPLPFDFALGWVGYLGYELKAETGGEAAHTSPHPDAAMIFADRAVAVDHETGELYLMALAEAGDTAGADAWLDETEHRLTEPAVPAQDASEPVGPLDLRHDRARYLDLIDECLRQITAGESYEICLTNMITATGRLDPWPAYRALRTRNPVPFGAFLRFGDLSVLSCSPERFLRVGQDRRVESKPIKGTRPRGRTPEEDERLRLDLRHSKKDRAENLMIVDLVRNDLGRCALPGTVTVDPIFDVETFTTVHQLVSTVSAQLRPDVSAVRCVREAFPGGSMTGAPKIRTMQIIDRLEQGPRGVYSGAIGYFSLSGAADLSIVIRTVVATPERVEFGVGGAIIALSDPAVEFEETAVKAAVLLGLTGRRFPERDAVTEPARSTR
ncbi:aminodeoxychorismate synthase component I [Actinokineospora diospyrosa]|uniref:aminodeoxychorismate synthase n=1 Tax=Actinokineospora diospyrosa TaxID=103728 RepID=A0ABT1IMI5_9PSEU|nr:aminodeoxychorismate synthase component I [Actinokineospora diospyrosa]MCP2273885.1 para-aminobenzoate synthetase [Actinokineospora diospyrosa]